MKTSYSGRGETRAGYMAVELLGYVLASEEERENLKNLKNQFWLTRRQKIHDMVIQIICELLCFLKFGRADGDDFGGNCLHHLFRSGSWFIRSPVVRMIVAGLGYGATSSWVTFRLMVEIPTKKVTKKFFESFGLLSCKSCGRVIARTVFNSTILRCVSTRLRDFELIFLGFWRSMVTLRKKKRFLKERNDKKWVYTRVWVQVGSWNMNGMRSVGAGDAAF